MPNINDEYKAQRAAVVPDLVLKRVVKHYELSLRPFSRLIGYSDPRAGRHHQTQVRTDPAISWTSMRPDVHNRMHYWELYLQREIVKTVCYYVFISCKKE